MHNKYNNLTTTCFGPFQAIFRFVPCCFFLGCKANARVILAKTGHGRHSSKIVVLFYVLFVLYCSMYCLCVNVYCHRVTTQLQLTNKKKIFVHSLFLVFSSTSLRHLFLSFTISSIHNTQLMQPVTLLHSTPTGKQ